MGGGQPQTGGSSFGTPPAGQLTAAGTPYSGPFTLPPKFNLPGAPWQNANHGLFGSRPSMGAGGYSPPMAPVGVGGSRPPGSFTATDGSQIAWTFDPVSGNWRGTDSSGNGYTYNWITGSPGGGAVPTPPPA